LYADPLIDKIYSNFIDNSLRPGERVTTIRFSCERSDKGVIIVYEDNGVGVQDSDKEKIFRKGFGKHTGLGLFLAREIHAITNLTIRETGTLGEGVRLEIFVPTGQFRIPSWYPGELF